MITKKVERVRDADFDEYSFPYSQRELAIRIAAPILPQRTPQLEGTSLGLRGAPTARGSSAHIRNGRRDCTVDADESRQARGPDPIHPKPQAIVATTTTSNPRSSLMDSSVVGQVFSKLVVQLVSAMKAVHLEPKTTTSL